MLKRLKLKTRPRRGVLADRPVLRRKRAPEMSTDSTYRTLYNLGKVGDIRRFAVEL